MREDNGGRVIGQRLLDDLARIHAGAADTAAEQLAKGDHPMLVIQHQTAEHLVLIIAHQGLQVSTGGGWAIDSILSLQHLTEVALRHFQHRLQLCVLGRAESMVTTKIELVAGQ